MENRLSDYLLTFFAGVALSSLVSFDLSDDNQRYQIYYRESNPSVMRFHNSYGQDFIYVETEKGSNKFKSLSDYLSKLDSKSERDLERISIEKAINCNDENIK
ncbi:MAG: hypothetical protein AABW83_02900 [Nanoarchaeota archaeon]